MDTVHYHKNKLAVDYATIPVLLNFNFTPHRRHEFGISAGASFAAIKQRVIYLNGLNPSCP